MRQHRGISMNRLKKMTCKHNKTSWVGFLIISTIIYGNIYSYEISLFKEIDFFADKYMFGYARYSLSDFSNNPAFLKNDYRKDINRVHFGIGKELNPHHRYYDPRENEKTSLEMQWIKHLDEKSALMSNIQYHYNLQIDVERSLEKNFYTHYFSFSDTTKGDLTYHGPKLKALYNRYINNNILVGIDLNYGVERGMKDKYTECETIIRSLSISTGLGYISDDYKMKYGVSATYFNRESKYESVKYYIEAFNRLWFGYHMYMNESPMSKIRKFDNREGYEISLQIEKQDFLISGFGYRLVGSFGEHNNEIETGSSSNLGQQGYWQRSAWQLLGNLFYNYEFVNTQFYIVYYNYEDWAKPQDYSVLNIENIESRIKTGGKVDFSIMNGLKLTCGLEFSSTDVDYNEFATKFVYQEINNSMNSMLGVDYRINQISNIYLSGNYGFTETDFHWEDTGQLNIMGGTIGYSRQFLFGRIDACLNYSLITQDVNNKKNEQFGIKLFINR